MHQSVPWQIFVRRSSNGRTLGFGPSNLGSNPSLRASYAVCQPIRLSQKVFFSSPMRLFFIRHGQADHNRRLLTNESNRHISNLTEQGQGGSFGERPASSEEKAKFDIIYCSPLERCRQTAAIVQAEHRGKPRPTIKINKHLSEFKTGFDNRLALIWFFHLLLSKNKLTKKFKGGQSITEAAADVEKFWQEIHAEHLDGNVLIVAHLNYLPNALPSALQYRSYGYPGDPHFHLDTGSWHEFLPKSRK